MGDLKGSGSIHSLHSQSSEVKNHDGNGSTHSIPTHLNTAAEGTRGVSPGDVAGSSWLNGPVDVHLGDRDNSARTFSLVEPHVDMETRPTCLETECKPLLGTTRFERLSDWDCLVESIALLKHYIVYRNEDKSLILPKSLSYYQIAERFLIKTVQQEVYAEEIDCLRSSQPLPKNSSILTLNPFIDDEGIIRVGACLKHLQTDAICKNPILLSGKHYIATLLICKCQQLVMHQGWHFTEGKVRSMGYWITGCKRLVSSLIHKGVTCRRQRRQCNTQKMYDPPEDRIDLGQPPFTSVGVDIFGPWEVLTRRTRGGSANSRRWAALFTCLVTRAVHIEVLEEMSSSSFIN